MNMTMVTLSVIIVTVLVTLVCFLERSNGANAVSDPLEYVRNLNHSKIIFDTDSGADDAMAIMTSIQHLAKEKKDVKVLAITCVHGNTGLENVKINVLKTLKTVDNLEIPVYAGANSTILATPMDDEYFYGEDGLGDFEFPNPPDVGLIKSEHAVNALIRLVRENPGEITLIALGPLTNVALAIRLDPTFRENLRYLIVMGGSVSGYGNVSPGIEFNAFMDPVANHIVFDSTNREETSPTILLPWDTMILYGQIDKEWRFNTLGKIDNELVDFLNKAESKSIPKQATWISSDTYAAATALYPIIATAAEQYYVHAVYEGQFRGGYVPDKSDVLGKYKNTIVVTSVDREIYKDYLIKCLS